MHPQYRITCTYFITTSHIIHLFGLYAAYLILRCWPWDSSASPMSSTNPLSEWSSQTPSKVCLCTKNSTTIYCNQTLCIGRGTWGALCALLPCGEIAVNTFPPPFSDRGSVVRQPCSVHYPPLPHWAETPRHIRNSTFTTFGSSNAHGENGCCFLYILRLPPHPARLSFRVFIARTWLDFHCTKPGSPGANWFYSFLWFAGENYARASLWMWNMISLLSSALLQNEKCYFTFTADNINMMKENKCLEMSGM